MTGKDINVQRVSMRQYYENIAMIKAGMDDVVPVLPSDEALAEKYKDVDVVNMTLEPSNGA